MRDLPKTLITAALAAAVLVSGPALGQRRDSLADRVARLEQELDNRGTSEQQDTLAELIYELNQLQAEVRELRGMVEQQSFEIENLQSSQRDQYLDLDRRISAIGGGTGDGRPVSRSTAPAEPADRAAGGDAMPGPSVAETEAADREPIPRRDLPEVREPIDAGLETSGLGQRRDAEVAELVDPEEEKAAYDEAFDALKNGRYAEASRLFSSFVQQYPNSEYSDNAQYWLGESYYVTRNYRVALESFQQLISRFPNSAKLPDARLKIGLSYYSLQNWEAAERELQQVVEEYPNTTVARLAQNRLRTMRIEGYID